MNNRIDNSMPLVSIMIISYNQAEYIEETVRSALEQDYDNLEVVVSDDGSVDGTVEILKTLRAEYGPRLKMLIDNKNVGITKNSNRGVFACGGEFIAFQGGDDVLLPGKISAQIAWFLQDERRVLCYHDAEVFDSDTGRTICKYSDIAPLISGSGASAVIRRMKLGAATSTMVRARCLPEQRFDERLPVVSDWKLWIDILAGGGQYGYVDGIYARYRRHSSNSRLTMSPAYFTDCYLTVALVEATYPFYCADARIARARVASVHALHVAFAGNRRLAWKLWWHAGRSAMISIKYTFGLVFAMLPDSGQRILARMLGRWIPLMKYARV